MKQKQNAKEGQQSDEQDRPRHEDGTDRTGEHDHWQGV